MNDTKQNPKLWKNYIPHIVLFLLAVSTLLFAVYPMISSNEASGPSLVGAHFKDGLNVEDAGEVKELKSFLSEDKNIFIFWATWCDPCVAEMRDLPKILPALRKKASVTLINYDGPENRDKAQMLLQALSLNSTYDDRGDILASLGISMLPASLLVDKSGKILKVHWGKLTAADF